MKVKAAVTQLRASGFSDADIAAAVGCGVSTISMWAAGKRATRTGDYLFNLFTLHAEKCPAGRKRRVPIKAAA